MKTCSETIKACGLKSTRQVAQLNGVSDRTVQLAYKHDYPKFRDYLYTAAKCLHDDLVEQIEEITG